MRGEALIAHMRSLQGLPALPAVVGAVSRRIAMPGARPAEIGRLLAHDQALTARVLRLANSAFYAPREAIRSPEQAVVLLGLGTLRAIILKASVFGLYDLAKGRSYWLHALATACAARATARLAGLARADDAFVMGLLHDIGKLALAEHLPAELARVRARQRADGCSARAAEMIELGVDHAELGRVLCEHWSLPVEFREAASAHHDLDRAGDAGRSWAACIHLADIMSRALLLGGDGDPVSVLDPRALALLGLDEGRFPALFRASEEELGRAEVFFAMIEG